MKSIPLTLLFGLLGLSWPAHGLDKPNILWLVAEDFGQHLGCYGAKEVWTPNLDRLAAEGVRYDRFFNGHVCSPSRSAFNTGMYATTIGAHNHRTTNKQPLPEGVKTRLQLAQSTATESVARGEKIVAEKRLLLPA